jgi:hypothetical protein
MIFDGLVEEFRAWHLFEERPGSSPQRDLRDLPGMARPGYDADSLGDGDYRGPGYADPRFGAAGSPARSSRAGGFGIPEYERPGYGTPAYGAAGYGAAEFGTPAYGSAELGAAEYGGAEYGGAGYGGPGYGGPEYDWAGRRARDAGRVPRPGGPR